MSLTYQFGSNTFGNLTYAYDPLGRRTQVGGNFARTGLPGAVTSTVYDATNELNNWNGTAIAYDLNGNMLTDGSHTFTWNARNEVATLNGVSFQYDAFGRRIKKVRITIMSSMLTTKGEAPMMTSSILPRLRRPCTT